MYRHLSVTDGSPVSLDKVSDDARIYAISEASVSAAAPAPQRTQRNRPKCSFRPKCPKRGPRGVSCKCSMSSRCVEVPRVDCIAGRCVCEVGYSFDHKANICRSLAECTSFKDSFTTYVAKQIKHHSVTNMTYVSYHNCVGVCRNYTQAMCKSVSVETLSLKCFLHNTTWLEVQETHRKAAFFRSLFQRDCCW
ncbi:uncharacterized protein [Haliotis cracherodii]|uniref:uncharacterized protein n=1 Tax=Haliotis cracherodii TaxID=6455 RepID=UPI0039EC7B7C